jgi:hypothetical protein
LFTEGAVQKICFFIKPYQDGSLWFFDDPSVGLFREALTDGVPEVLAQACFFSDVKKIFCVSFSNHPLGDYFLNHVKPLRNGNLYKWNNMKCWFCPALLKYFQKPPKTIWFSVFGHKNI